MHNRRTYVCHSIMFRMSKTAPSAVPLSRFYDLHSFVNGRICMEDVRPGRCYCLQYSCLRHVLQHTQFYYYAGQHHELTRQLDADTQLEGFRY